MAAWEFESIARENLRQFWMDAFDGVTRDWRGYGEMPSPGVLADDVRRVTRRLDCECPSIRNPLAVFRVDLRDSTITTHGANLPADILSRLVDTLTTHRLRYDRERAGMVMMPEGSVSVSPVLITYSTAYGRGRSREALGLFGLMTDPDAYSDLLSEWFLEHELLPPSVTGGQPNDSLLDLAVRFPGGSTVPLTDLPGGSEFAASDTMDAQYGNMIVEASIKPDVAERLIIGGLPRSRLPIILTLLLITILMGTTALYQLRRERQLARLRDDFVSGVSHELRTPLAQVRMFAELWEAGKLRTEADRSRSIGIINREARRLTHLVENILQFSRSRRATADIKAEPLDMQDTVTEVIEAFRPLADARGVSINATIEAGLVVRADRDAIKQILLNLLDNAVKYGPEGQIVTIDASRIGATLRLAVDDQGPGIPHSERHLVWEPYRRLQRDKKSAATGTGIGLAVVAELAALHDGVAWVESTAQGGASFVVELPGAKTASRAKTTLSTELRA